MRKWMRVQDLAVISITSILILTGAWYAVHSIAETKKITGIWLPDSTEKFTSLYALAGYGLVVATAGAVVLTYYFLSKERQLWKIRTSRKLRDRRSAIIITFGLGMALLGLGGAAIHLYESSNMPSDIIDYESKSDGATKEGRSTLVVGMIGAGVLVYGALFSREPELEFTDNESFLFRRPLWQGTIVLIAGVAILVASWLYGTYNYNAYLERDEEGTLTLVVAGGLFIALLSTVVGLGMIARSSPSLRFRGELYPHESSREGKD